MKLAIVIPSYNERQNIEALINQVFKVFPEASVVVVDDNSPDGTPALIRQLAKKYRNLHLILRKNKQGRGSAVIRGLAFAQEKLKAEIFVEMDADCSHDPEELPDLLKQADARTVVIGSRYVKGARIINWPQARLISSRLANCLIRLVLGLSVRDNTNGFRVYSPAAVAILLKHHFVSKGYISLSEISYLLSQRGFRLIEVPTVFTNRVTGKSNATIREFFDSIINLFRIRLRVR